MAKVMPRQQTFRSQFSNGGLVTSVGIPIACRHAPSSHDFGVGARRVGVNVPGLILTLGKIDLVGSSEPFVIEF